MVIDPSRVPTLVAGTTDEFNLPVIITAPTGYTLAGQRLGHASPSPRRSTTSALAYYGNPSGASQYGSTDSSHSATDFPTDRSYLDVAFAPTAGDQLVAGTIGSGGQFTLSGTGASGFTVGSGSNGPVYLGDNTYRFLLFGGTFTPGTVNVNFTADTWYAASPRGPPCPVSNAHCAGTGTTANGTGYGNLAFTTTFTVTGATADLVSTDANGQVSSLSGGTIGRGQLNGQGYLEVSFQPTAGNTIDAATINGNELTLTDAAGHTIALRRPDAGGHDQRLALLLHRHAGRRDLHRDLRGRLVRRHRRNARSGRHRALHRPGRHDHPGQPGPPAGSTSRPTSMVAAGST